jgi:two-component system OmpR family response regulator
MNYQKPIDMLAKIEEKGKPDRGLLFIVEDNNVYARLLKVIIQTRFPEIKTVEIFPVGELCLAELDRNPAIIIMDYFLNTSYSEEDEKHNGLSIIKRIRSKNPHTNILLLSNQKNMEIALDAIEQYGCSYVQKGNDAFNKVEVFIRAVINHKIPPAFEHLL